MEENSIKCINMNLCTACGACENICPAHAVVMQYDQNGFMYPIINENCINCGKCKSVCQVINPVNLYDSPDTYAVWNKNKEVRMASSSGGFFSIIAQYVIDRSGVVFGAVYTDNFDGVYTACAKTMTEVTFMRGSKYVFCETREAFQSARNYLENGNYVLYTGTPCEIAGLISYLGKNYEKLITCDFVCHGANSVAAYQSWLLEFTKGQTVKKLDFRDKSVFKWSTTATAYLENGNIIRENYENCYWYKGFLEGVIIRKNCSTCPYAKGERCADFTMGDAWQVGRISKAYNDQLGTSLILVNSDKGKRIYEVLKSEMELCKKIDLEEIRKYNGNLNYPQKQHSSRRFFFSHLDKDGYHKALWYGRGLRWDVGIVGWWFASNYGSALTYYVLAKSIEKTGKSIIFIPVPQLNGKDWDSDTQIVEEFMSKHFKIANKRDYKHLNEMNRFCDSFLLGSDQMWTESTTELVGYSFFLDFVDKEKKKVACATSFGASHFNTDLKMRYTARDYLKQFDAISVREESGVEICHKAFGINAEQIIDPIFWEGKTIFDQLVDSETENELPEHYLLCYILDPDEEKKKFVKYIAEKNKLTILSVLGMKEYNINKDCWHIGQLVEKPAIEEFVLLVKKCDFLITDSHHGTCMGIIYEKNYFALGNKKRGIDRFLTVAEKLGTQNRVVTQPFDYDRVNTVSKIDYKQVRFKLEQEILRAKEWLKKAFEKETIPGEETVYSLLRRIEKLEEQVRKLQG